MLDGTQQVQLKIALPVLTGRERDFETRSTQYLEEESAIEGNAHVENSTYLLSSYHKGIQGPTEDFTRHGNLQTGHNNHFLGRGISGCTDEARAWSKRRS